MLFIRALLIDTMYKLFVGKLDFFVGTMCHNGQILRSNKVTRATAEYPATLVHLNYICRGLLKKYHLLTSSVRSLQGNLRPWPCCIDLAIARSIHQGLGLRFPCNDRADEVNKLFIVWPF